MNRYMCNGCVHQVLIYQALSNIQTAYKQCAIRISVAIIVFKILLSELFLGIGNCKPTLCMKIKAFYVISYTENLFQSNR